MELKFDSNGLLPAVAQDAASGEVLMVAWMNAEAVRLTLETGKAHFWSRSRGELWRKGATSGNVLSVREVWVDCDGDTLLLKVEAAGPACHTGEQTFAVAEHGAVLVVRERSPAQDEPVRLASFRGQGRQCNGGIADGGLGRAGRHGFRR